MTAKTAPEKYFELIERGYTKPAVEHVDLVMLGAYRIVPTELVYHVPEPPADTDVPEPPADEDVPES